MLLVALKMLIGNRASCIGVIFGIFLATLLISQQSAIFLGLVSRSYRVVTDIPAPNVWVMDPNTKSDDEARPMPTSYLDVVKSVPGVEWAVPIAMSHLPMTNQSNVFQIASIYGIDDATLVGAPVKMIHGKVTDLRREGGVIIDTDTANDLLANVNSKGEKIPLKVGDTLEINRQRAVIVGISKITQGFYPRPILFMAYSTLLRFDPTLQNNLGLIAAKTKEGYSVEEVTQAIDARGGMNARSREAFKTLIIDDFLGTGILINFGLSVALGIIIGFSIAGQIFYILTLNNLKYYSLIRALGGPKKMLFHMIVLQTLVVGTIGFLLGIGTTVLWEYAIRDTTLAFLFNWQLLLFTGLLVLLICVFTAGMSIRKVLRVDPMEVLGT